MEFLMEAKDLLLSYLVDLLKSGWWIWIPAQAFVFILGRMLEVLNTNRTRNSFATILLLMSSYGYTSLTFVYTNMFEMLWLWIHWFSLGILWYVIIGFKLIPRMDNLLDKHFANDEIKEPKKRRK